MRASGEMGVVQRTGDRGCGRETVSAMHAVNLIALATFYKTTQANLTGQRLLEPGTFKQPANLTINFFSDEARKLLARDDEVAYSLKKLAKGLRNDSLVYSSATCAILFKYIQKQSDNRAFWSFQQYGWVSYIVAADSALLGLMVLYLYCVRRQGGNQLAPMAVTALPLLPRVTAFDLKTISPPTVANTAGIDMVKQWVSELREQEWIRAAIIIDMVLQGIILFLHIS